MRLTFDFEKKKLLSMVFQFKPLHYMVKYSMFDIRYVTYFLAVFVKT